MMTNRIAGQFGGVPYKYFGDWTDRIAKGELPKAKPPRPEGEERNIVITSWEWSKPDKYLHDLISSDRRNPTVNAYGPLYGSPEYSTDNMPILDPKTNKVSFFKMPVRDPAMPVSLGPGHAGAVTPTADSPYWAGEVLWDTRANNHNSMFDKQGRIWLAATVRGMDNPDWCKKGSSNPYAKVFPIDKSPRQVAMLDPKTMKYDFIDTCFGTHHPQFGYDADNTLWLSGTGPVAGWINTKVWDETHDAQKAVGWTPFILDTNGNGKRDDYTEPGQPADTGKDTRITGGSGPYAVMPNPKDGSIWYTVGVFGGQAGFMRFDPKTQLSEFFAMPKPGVGVRGGDIDANGVAWGSESSGHLVSFDRRLCKGPLNGPNATGNHCPEGWKFYKYPGPGFEGFEDRSVEASYYTWVDQHNTRRFRRKYPDFDRKPQRRFRSAEKRQDGPAAHSVPHGLLRQGSRRTHRRSECRLERPRPVEHQWRSYAVADGDRQGIEPTRGSYPDPSRPAGALIAAPTKRNGPRRIRRGLSFCDWPLGGCGSAGVASRQMASPGQMSGKVTREFQCDTSYAPLSSQLH